MRQRNKIREGSKTINGLLIVLTLFAVLLSVYPFIYMVLLSLMKTYTMKLSVERLLNAEWTFENYAKLLRQSNLLIYIKNSVIITVYAVFVSCMASSMAAYAFAKKRFFGRRFLFFLFLLTMMIPGQVTLIPCFLILKKLGMLNTYSAIALPSCGAFGVLLVHQFMGNVPNDLLEAADIDGCSEFKKFFSIVIPLIKPVLISLSIFMFISVWNSLLLPMVVSTKSSSMTLTVAIASMKTKQAATDYGYIMAASTVSFLPPFILYLFLQKQFVEGIALSGTKV